jgi:arylsulfatase A-like enzyme
MTLNRRELLAGAAAAGAATAAPAKRPNILHIMSDQQQWATIAGRSECRTPNIDRLAKAGMLFERSYTPSAVCCPARAMTLSGAFHWHNGVYNQIHSSPSVHRDMNTDVVLYSQRLRDAGYRATWASGTRATCARRSTSATTTWRAFSAAAPRCSRSSTSTRTACSARRRR